MSAGPLEKILVVGPSWVGDMVMAHSLFQVLKQRHPDAIIDVLAPAWSSALTGRMPEIRHAITSPAGHGELGWGKRRAIGRDLRAERYDQAILLPNSLKSALIPWFARIPRRTGFLGEMRYGLVNDIRPLDKSVLTMTVQRFVALGLPPDATLPPDFPAPALQIDQQQALHSVEKFGLSTDQPVLALCPGAEYGPAKRWPEAHYAEVARNHLQKGGAVWLFGSEKDDAVCKNINRLADLSCANLAGRTSLGEAIDLLALSDAVVSNDSGLMHVAAALDKKLIAIYGSSDPGFTPPLNQNSEIISLGLPCSPCFERQCPLGHLDCLNKLLPQQVVAALDKEPPNKEHQA